MTADLGSAATIGLRKISEIDRLLWTLGVLAVAAVAYVYGLKLNTPPIRSDGRMNASVVRRRRSSGPGC
jgi:hypothetical protein